MASVAPVSPVAAVGPEVMTEVSRCILCMTYDLLTVGANYTQCG